MDEALIERWNSVVQPGDKVYVLGDVAIPRSGLQALSSLASPFVTLMVRSPRKGRMTRWYGTGPASSGTIMNPLALIKQQIEKAARLREAQHASLFYRGISYVPKPHWF